MRYAVLSPRNAPAAANAITSGRLMSPDDESTPAVMTIVSLGTSGMIASR